MYYGHTDLEKMPAFGVNKVPMQIGITVPNRLVLPIGPMKEFNDMQIAFEQAPEGLKATRPLP